MKSSRFNRIPITPFFCLFFCLCFISDSSASSLALRKSVAGKTGFLCGTQFFPNDKLGKAVTVVCDKLSINDQNKRFPTLYDGNLFNGSNLNYYLYPMTKKEYANGDSPGPYRIIVDEGCNLAGALNLEKPNHGEFCEMIGTPSPLLGIDPGTKLKDVISEDGYKCGSRFYKMSTLDAEVEKACPSVREGRTGKNKYPVKFYSPLFSESNIYMWFVKAKRDPRQYFIVMRQNCSLVGAMFSAQGHFTRCREVRWGPAQLDAKLKTVTTRR